MIPSSLTLGEHCEKREFGDLRTTHPGVSCSSGWCVASLNVSFGGQLSHAKTVEHGFIDDTAKHRICSTTSYSRFCSSDLMPLASLILGSPLDGRMSNRISFCPTARHCRRHSLPLVSCRFR